MRVTDDGPALDAIVDVIARVTDPLPVIVEIVRNTGREVGGRP